MNDFKSKKIVTWLIGFYAGCQNRIRNFYLVLKAYKRFWKGVHYFLACLGVVITLLLLWMVVIPGIQELSVGGSKQNDPRWSPEEKNLVEKHKRGLNKSLKGLSSRLNYYKPSSPYIVINSELNRFYLYKGGKLVREGVCSTGSNVLLENEASQQWVFKTPKGQRQIQVKKTSPVWNKPDWAFVEEGMDIPPQNHPSRYERGVLGDYALSMGDGYMIHGTLFQRFLGLPVTHGCIRLGDDDLKVVYKTLRVGSKVYIY